MSIDSNLPPVEDINSTAEHRAALEIKKLKLEIEKITVDTNRVKISGDVLQKQRFPFYQQLLP